MVKVGLEEMGSRGTSSPGGGAAYGALVQDDGVSFIEYRAGHQLGFVS